MLPTERLWIDVEVRLGDELHPGTLQHRRPTEGDWQGFGRYTAAPNSPKGTS